MPFGPWNVLYILVKFVCADETCGSNTNVLPNFSLALEPSFGIHCLLEQSFADIADLHIGNLESEWCIKYSIFLFVTHSLMKSLIG